MVRDSFRIWARELEMIALDTLSLPGRILPRVSARTAVVASGEVSLRFAQSIYCTKPVIRRMRCRSRKSVLN